MKIQGHIVYILLCTLVYISKGQLSLKEDLKTIKECDINTINFNCSNNDDEIIAVQSIEFWYSPECESVCCEYNSSHAKDDPSSGDIEAVRRMCSGKQSCTLNFDVLRDFSPFGLQKSVYVIIQFHCIPRARRTSVCSSDVELMSNGLPLYLTSENYPSVVTGNSMCSCSFSSCSSNINLYVIDVDLYLEPANCEQSLQVLSGADAVLHEMNCESHYDRNDIAVTNLNSRYVNINFINNSTQNQEGYFFLGFAASDQNTNFTLTCRDEPASNMCIDCGAPANVDGANVSTSNDNLENSVATYVCENGHTHTSGDLELTCGSDGKWNGTAPVCTPDCGTPSNADSANVTTSNGNIENSIATYVCESGYSHTAGDLKHSCGTDGKWNGTSPVCTPDCGTPANVDGANVTTSNDNLENSVATYVCENGYTHTSGDLERTCGSDGKWNGTAPVCTSDCGAPANVEGANVTTSNDNLENSVATYVCENGHTHTSGDLERTCWSDGKWNGTAPVCTPDCGSPANVDGANVTTSNDNLENSVATYVCVNGYNHTFGNLERTCESDGDWNGTLPVCTSDCGTPAVVDGASITTSNGSLENSVSTYVCENGYTHTSGDLERTCKSDGNWNGTSPVCTPDCGTPVTVDGANVTTSNGSIDNSVATYFCEDGYTHTSGDLKHLCAANGNWKGTMPVCTRDCGPPENVTGAVITTSNGSIENSTANYICTDGYAHTSGNLQLTCGSESKWNGTVPVCTPDCGPPENITKAVVTTSNGSIENSVATYACENGYAYISGDLQRVCGSDSKWNGSSPACIPDCGSPETVTGATAATSNGSIENSTATYSCENGYTHTGGNLKRICDSNGTWSGTLPTCTPDCGNVNTIENGNLTLANINATLVGATATVSCNKGYNISAPSITCLSSGQWESAACSIIDCGQPPLIMHGIISVSLDSSTTYGSIARVVCDTEYKTEKQNVVCKETGSWEKSVCKRKADQDVPVTILVSVLVAVVVVATVAVALILVLKILPQKTPNMPSIEYSRPFSPSPPLAWNSPVHAMKEEQIFDLNHDAYIYDGRPYKFGH